MYKPYTVSLDSLGTGLVAVHVFTDAGRISRPLLIVERTRGEDGQEQCSLLIKKGHIVMMERIDQLNKEARAEIAAGMEVDALPPRLAEAHAVGSSRFSWLMKPSSGVHISHRKLTFEFFLDARGGGAPLIGRWKLTKTFFLGNTRPGSGLGQCAPNRWATRG